MSGRPERILVFRSGRHLQTAIDALRRSAPLCEITVVARPEAAAALGQAGIDAAHWIRYDRTAFFRPWAFIASGAWLRAWAGRYDRVCVLWNDPDGVGQVNVDHTALTVSPRGFTAITPDGTVIPRPSGVTLRREIGRAALSVVVGTCLAVAVFLPARLCAAGRVVIGRRGGA